MILGFSHLSPKLVFQVGVPTVLVNHTGRIQLCLPLAYAPRLLSKLQSQFVELSKSSGVLDAERFDWWAHKVKYPVSQEGGLCT